MAPRHPRLLTVGDNVVDVYPDEGVLFPGGNAVNVAVHGGRCGADTAYIGAVGTDPAGSAVLEALRAENVDLSRTRIVEGRNAHAEVHLVDGNRVFGRSDDGISRFRLTAADLAAAGSYDIVHTGECSMLEEQLPRLRAASRLLSFDFSERPWDYIQQHAPYAHLAIVSAPVGDPAGAREQATRLRQLGPSVVAVTLGARGAAVLDDSGWSISHPPGTEGGVVDTLGAGDAFIARFLVGLAAGEPVQVRLDAATAYATASCLSYGAFGYPTPIHDRTPSLAPVPNHRLDTQ